MFYTNFNALNDQLNVNELLVRDGVAKLVVCWTLWEVGRHYRHFKNHTNESWHQAGEWASGRIFWAKDTDSISAKEIEPEGRFHKDTSPGIMLKGDFAAKLIDIDGKTFLSKQTISKELGQLCWWKTLEPRKRLPAILKVASGSAWRGANWLPVTMDQLKYRASKKATELDFPRNGIEVYKSFASVARMLVGSNAKGIAALERTTVKRHLNKEPLTKFQTFDVSGENAASPIPLGVLLRWGKLFCFGPILPDDANEDDLAPSVKDLQAKEQAVWDAFCGPHDGAHGKPLGDFVDALRALIEADGVIHKAEARKKGVLFPKGGGKIGLFNPISESSSAASRESGIRGFRVNMTSPPPGGRTRLNLGSENARLCIRELGYFLRQKEEDTSVFASRRLILRWDIPGTGNLLNDHTFGNSAWVFEKIAQLNPVLNVEAANWDGPYLQVIVRHSEDNAFPPHETVISNMKFPDAHFRSDGDHIFSVHVFPDQVGAYERVGGALRAPVDGPTQDESQGGLRAAEAAIHEVKQELEAERIGWDPACLGTHPFGLLLNDEGVP